MRIKDLINNMVKENTIFKWFLFFIKEEIIFFKGYSGNLIETKKNG